MTHEAEASASDPAFDTLVHVGLHKCASTWLQQNFFPQNPTVFEAPWKFFTSRAVTDFVVMDPVCFDAEALRQDYDSQRQAGRIGVVSHEALSSRPHHGRYYSLEVANRLKSVFPNSKLLFVFRHQSKIIYSLYGEYIRNGGTHTLQEFIGTGHEPAGWQPAIIDTFFEYDRLLTMYRSVFGEDNVLALPLELLSRDSRAFHDKIYSFCGVTDGPLIGAAANNTAWSAGVFEFYRRSNKYVHKNPLGPNQSPLFNLRRKIASKIDIVLPKSLSARMIKRHRAMIEDRFGDRFEASNTRLAEMVGLDLKSLGYPCQ